MSAEEHELYRGAPEPVSGHSWSGSVESVEMDTQVLDGSSQTITVNTWRHRETGHNETSPDSCSMNFVQTGVEVTVRVLIDGQEVAKQTKCTGDDEVLGSEGWNTFNISHDNPDTAGFYDYAVEVVSDDTGAVEDRFETVLSVTSGPAPDLRIADVSPEEIVAQPGEQVSFDVAVENRGDVDGSGPLVVTYKGREAFRDDDVDLQSGEGDSIGFDLTVGAQTGQFDLQIEYGSSVRNVSVIVQEEEEGPNCTGAFSAFTNKQCCPIHFTIDTPTQFGNVDPPNICLLAAGGAIVGVLLVGLGGSIITLPIDVAVGVLSEVVTSVAGLFGGRAVSVATDRRTIGLVGSLALALAVF